MSSSVSAAIAVATQATDALPGNILVSISGPAGFAAQSITIGSGGGSATFSMPGGAALPTGTYTVTAQSQDVNGKPAAFNGVAYPAVTATVNVSQEQSPVASAISLTVA